jgi:hypothetical protein
MADIRDVVINPLLRLRTVAETTGVRGGPKDVSKITPSLYAQRQAYLIRRLGELRDSPQTAGATHDGRVLLWAGMDGDSQASTHTPTDLFSDDVGCQVVSAWRSGYVVEFSELGFDLLAERIENPQTGNQRCDIFRVETLDVLASLLADAENLSAAWDQALPDSTGRRAFNVRLPAFLSATAEASVAVTLEGFAADNRVALPVEAIRVGLLGYDGASAGPTWLPAPRFAEEAEALTISGGPLPLGIRDRAVLRQLIASGAIVRWEPVSTVQPTMPGVGPEPEPSLPALDGLPIVGVIDGGYHGSRYRSAVAWKLEPALVDDARAAKQHGAKVASIVVDGHLWSNQLQLPQLHCRIGLVQAVPDLGSSATYLDQQLLNHIERAFREHPETHVWNLSANFDRACDEFEVSELGHGLTRLARAYSKVLVISAGNRSDTSRIAPPADCEAAIIVSGREHDGSGRPAGPCSLSRTGLGPEGMLKPETSWFSEHRVVGGGIDRGTSFAAPLVSRLAAHTWQHLAEPNPDLVKGLLINACDLEEYDAALGFGSPVAPQLPWTCQPNAAVVAWTAPIKAMQRYYWTGIRVPPSLIKNGRFVGRAKLVALIDPVLQMQGHHYMSTRLEAALQYRKVRSDGKVKNETMVGCMNPSERELEARTYDHKWDPVRVYSDAFTETNGPMLIGEQPTLQVYGRMFWRNQFMYADDYIRNHEARVNFVVTLQAADPAADVYNEFRRIMAENVETALVDQDIHIDAGADDEDF